ncbi:adenylosuccinate synthase [Candidatus Gracilibacteria bacterium]|nr:adenylosuccinate synthase [Candidatus Gracilibacteria bacterium]MCF7855990.1 adenylosuccinate synthase [Candidatus Gracilibacteria bacterium]MCF7896317.1 adenylosuccinate synthase [Candidatus Gracilibacteria bacterium]
MNQPNTSKPKLFSTRLTAVIGLNWGDEGKGKLVDILASKSQFVARFGGGANAGHTIVVKGQKVVLHQLPSGVLHPQTKNVIGNGCVVHLPTLIEEIEELEKIGVNLTDRLFISDRATILFDFHKELDGLSESALGTKKIGTTKRGIGPAYADRVNRRSLRMGDLANLETFAAKLRERLEEVNKVKGLPFKFDIEREITLYQDLAERLEGMICDTSALLQEALTDGKTVLAEGAQGSLLDIEFGTFPFVTSSTTTAGNIFSGLGIPPQNFNSIGVAKAYTTRVGEGPFTTELLNETGEKLREVGAEFGATTGRPRRCGWMDLVATKYSAKLNGTTALNLTKLDVLNDFKEIQVCTKYSLDGEEIETLPATIEELERVEPIFETLPGWQTDTSAVKNISELPENAKAYIKFIEDYLKVPVNWVGVGVEREAMAS